MSADMRPWIVWSFVHGAISPATGLIEEPLWYDECACRNQVDAENIKTALEKRSPRIQYRVSLTKPVDIPDNNLYSPDGKIVQRSR